MTNGQKHFYEFGRFRLDPAERQLRRGAEVVPLTPKALDVLLLLVEQGGHALRKEEFLERVWADSHVEEKNLADKISEVRRALEDDPRAPTFIETVQRHGYRFVAEVKEVEEEGAGEMLVRERERARVVYEEEDESTARALPSAQLGRPRVRRRVSTVVIFVLAAAGLLAFYAFRRGPATATDAGAVRSLAVLPFKPLAANDRDESLELGMADTLITRLSAVGQLAVRPTSAVRRYTRLEDEAAAAGRELGVDAMLDGSIQKAGDRVRVSVRLVRAGEGRTLWAEQFDERFTDIFSVQDSIARRVVGALSLKLSGEEGARLTKRDTQDTEAYRRYLTGRYFWNKRTPEGFEKAIDYYERAAAADPNYALAHAGLAETYCLLPNWTGAPPEESYRRAERAARRALELDPQLAEAYTALSNVKISLYHDWAGAGEDCKRAIELSPNYATAHQWYGRCEQPRPRLLGGLPEPLGNLAARPPRAVGQHLRRHRPGQ
jgi:TolB-like protein/DNA-binding winged helix-turn-helix (wHTH) protein